jgi:DNA-binding protein HU-beta
MTATVTPLSFTREGNIGMNKRELIDAVAEATGASKVDAAVAVDAVFGTISGALVRREKVAVSGFGNFEARFVNGRMARNPQTGASVPVAQHHSPKFKPASALKNAVR